MKGHSLLSAASWPTRLFPGRGPQPQRASRLGRFLCWRGWLPLVFTFLGILLPGIFLIILSPVLVCWFPSPGAAELPGGSPVHRRHFFLCSLGLVELRHLLSSRKKANRLKSKWRKK